MAEEGNKPSVSADRPSPGAPENKLTTPVRVQVVYGATMPAQSPPPEIHERKPAPATISDRKTGK